MELLWFLKGDTNIRFLLQNNNHIWDEWAFERYVKVTNIKGPDMTDFGHRSLTDPVFNEQYKEQHQLFCEKVLTDDDFARNLAILDTSMDINGVIGNKRRGFIDQIKK